MNEENELIQDREFGDKFNELTSFIYDNFSVLKGWALKYIVPCSLAVAALNFFMPDSAGNPIGWILFFVDLLIVCMLSTVFVTVLKPYFLENKELKDIRLRSLLPQLLRNVVTSLASACIPLVCIFVIAYLMSFLKEEHHAGDFFLSTMKGIVLIIVSIPIFMTIIVNVIEGKTGMKNLSRSLNLSKYDILVTAIIIFFICIIGSILPMISEIVTLIISEIDDLFFFHDNSEVNETVQNILEYLSFSVTFFFLIFQLFMITFAMLLEYGNAVEEIDNLHFLNKFNNFDNL